MDLRFYGISLFCLYLLLGVNFAQAASSDNIPKPEIMLKTQVWSLELKNEYESGPDLRMLFQSSYEGGQLALPDTLSIATVSIVPAKLKNSVSIMNTLSKWGNAKLITSGGGQCNNNMPLPIIAIEHSTYPAWVTSPESGIFGQEITVTPEVLTIGFNMLLIPHILDKGCVALQYRITHSTLDKMQKVRVKNGEKQFPQISTKGLHGTSTMKPGQTFILVGFQYRTEFNYAKTLLITTVELEAPRLEVGRDL